MTWTGRSMLAGAILALLIGLGLPTVARSHPLGNFTVNLYSRIEPAGDGVRIVYVLDMAEIPAFQEIGVVDADRDGQTSRAEEEQYATQRSEEIRRNLRLELNGTPVPLGLIERQLSFPPGQGGLATLRLDAVYFARLPSGPGAPVDLTSRDDNFPGRIGWREIVARPSAIGTELLATSVPATDQSDELRSYPEDLLSSPLDVRSARISFVPGAAPAAPLAAIGIRASDRTQDAFAALVSREELTPGLIVFYLLSAMVLGAGHALSPGHGKTVVAAYLVGSRGTARHAVFLGITVTATHTIGVYALGLVTLYLSQYILPERLYPILQVVSGLLVVGIGIWLFIARLAGLPWFPRQHGRTDDHAHGHRHGDDHAHGHPHGDGHAHGHGHDHIQDGHADRGHQRMPVAATAPVPIAVGMTASASPARAPSVPQAMPSTAVVASASGHGGPLHSHGGATHSHLPPGADGEPVTWRSLLALGVSGGLLPCPSALVVLLSAIALQRVAFGLLLIVAFSVGLASVLVGIGLLLVFAGRFFNRLSVGGGLAVRLVPVLSALLVVVAGVVITAQALPSL